MARGGGTSCTGEGLAALSSALMCALEGAHRGYRGSVESAHRCACSAVVAAVRGERGGFRDLAAYKLRRPTPLPNPNPRVSRGQYRTHWEVCVVCVNDHRGSESSFVLVRVGTSKRGVHQPISSTVLHSASHTARSIAFLHSHQCIREGQRRRHSSVFAVLRTQKETCRPHSSAGRSSWSNATVGIPLVGRLRGPS